MMVSKMPAMEPSLHRPHDLRLTLQPIRSMALPAQSPYGDRVHAAPDSASLCSPATEEAYKGSWTEMEDDYLRTFAEVRNATSTACDASRCRSKCIDLVCPHNWCSEDRCHHGRCSETECVAPNFVLRRPAPEGSLVMQPLDSTLCSHLTNTEKLWTEIASLVSRTCNRRRNAKQCRERWFQQLRPGLILHLPIQPEEGDLIAQLVREKGQKWAEISRHPRLQRRSDNAIKNWWNSSGNKKDRAAGGSGRGGGPPAPPPGPPRRPHPPPPRTHVASARPEERLQANSPAHLVGRVIAPRLQVRAKQPLFPFPPPQPVLPGTLLACCLCLSWPCARLRTGHPGGVLALRPRRPAA